MGKYPANTATVICLNEIFNSKEAPSLSERLSTRMVKIAAHLPDNEFIGWQMRVPVKGHVLFESFGTETVKISDLEWIAEESAKTSVVKNIAGRTGWNKEYENWELFEVYLPAETKRITGNIGFSASGAAEKPDKHHNSAVNAIWPMYFSQQFGELMQALRREGAVFRFIAGKATVDEQIACEKSVLTTWEGNRNGLSEYIGTPVRTKTLLVLPGSPSVTLLAVLGEVAIGAELRHIGNMSQQRCLHLWQNPMSEPRVLPSVAARILAMEPVIGDTPVVGVKSRREEAKPIPAGHKNPVGDGGLQIGRAIGSSGLGRKIIIGDKDMRRNWQIVGQTGTGKSTLLAYTICEAIIAGRGLTFFDPHGSTIDVILNTIPQEYADRIRVVRFGDESNPVPAAIWKSDNPEDNEKIISDLCLLFKEIYDPTGEGIVGPRWERCFSVFAFAAITLLGQKASFDSIITLSQNKDNIKKLHRAIRRRNPKLARSIESEYLNNQSSDFNELLNWFIAKFQRLTAVVQLRNTLGAGANALDFAEVIDTDAVTLIDLATPVMGTNASRILGTLLLLQLWNAVSQREKRDMTHITAIDEAHLFQTNPLPQMLSEGRKFGLAMILAHQHCGQLSGEVRYALDANSASFSAFRLSVNDAKDAVLKFDDISLHSKLCRLNAFNALTTISVDGIQTPVFTLQVDKPKYKQAEEGTAAYIENNSIERMVKPYRDCHALTTDEVMEILDHYSKNPLPPLMPERVEDIECDEYIEFDEDIDLFELFDDIDDTQHETASESGDAGEPDDVAQVFYANNLCRLLDYLDIADFSAEELLTIGIEKLDLSVRAYNSLKRAGINTLADITAKSEAELLAIRNFSKNCLEDVTAKIRRFGFGPGQPETAQGG